MTARALPALCAALACWIPALPAYANPADTFGFGSRSISLAGAVSANVRDTSANYYNPSSLSLAEAPSLSVGLVTAAPSLTVNEVESPIPSLSSLVFGLVVPGRIAETPVAFGFAGQIAGDRLSRIVTFAEDDQRWVLFDNRPEQLYLSGNLSVAPTPWLRFGAGYSFLASTSGRLAISGTAVQPGFGTATEFDSELQHEVVADLLSVRYPQFALGLSPTDALSFALVYRDEGQVSLNVDSNIAGSVGIGPLEIPTQYAIESETAQSYVPRQLVLGTSLLISETRANLDLSWTQWSGYPSPISATDSTITLEPPPGLVLDVPELPAATTLERAKMKDRISVRVGAERWFKLAPSFSLPARLGFAWDPTGVSESTNASLLDADRYIFSVGSGFEWDRPTELLPGQLRLEIHGQWIELGKRQVDSLTGESPARIQGSILGFGADLHYVFSD